MKTSELIKQLAKVISQYGDILIFPGAPDGKLIPTECHIQVANSEDGKKLAVIR